MPCRFDALGDLHDWPGVGSNVRLHLSKIYGYNFCNCFDGTATTEHRLGFSPTPTAWQHPNHLLIRIVHSISMVTIYISAIAPN